MKQPDSTAPEETATAPYEYCSNYRFSPQIKKISRLVTAVVPCLTGVGSIYQAFASAKDRRSFPPPGVLMDIDGCSMHVQVGGAGAPTVVLESGLGAMSAGWAWAQPEIAKFCRVISYDRTGLGWSGSDAFAISAQVAARRLRLILHHSQSPPPFVLVGHSMGGLLVRVFAELFRPEVAGVVLVDASHPDQHLRSSAIEEHMRSGFRLLRAIPVLTRLGYVRLTGLFDSWTDGLPPRQAAEAAAFLSSSRHLTTTYRESAAWDALCGAVRKTKRLGSIPLGVVSAGKDVLPGHPELQEELAALSGDSFGAVINGADHVSLVTKREHALAVVEIIREVVERSTISRKMRAAPHW